MKPLRSILACLALAAITTPAWAIQVPVTADTAGSPATQKIGKLAGTAASLPISSKSTAYLSFGIGASNIPAGSVTRARLILYFAKVTKAGNMTITLNGSAFQETFATTTIPTPSAWGFVSAAPYRDDGE